MGSTGPRPYGPREATIRRGVPKGFPALFMIQVLQEVTNHEVSAACLLKDFAESRRQGKRVQQKGDIIPCGSLDHTRARPRLVPPQSVMVALSRATARDGICL